MNESKPLFRTASRGLLWSLMTSVVVLSASLIAQLILGRLLSESEYGVYALAFASSDFLVVFRDGGVQLWLSRLTPRRFERLQGHAFWLATACSVVTSILLVGLAFVAGRVYGDSRITTYLLILAAAFPWTAYASVASAKLQVELKFRTMATVKLVSALARHSLVVLLAYLNWGPLSFAFAFLAITFLELLLYLILTRIRPWATRPSRKWAAWMFRGSRWSLGGSFATAILRQSDYLILGLFASKEVVGLYFFGYQLAMQPVLLFSESLRRVVLPTFARGFQQAEKRARSLQYVGVFLGTVAAAGLLGLAVTAKPLEEILWSGKWAGSVRPIQFLCLAMPFHLAAFVVEMFAQSQGRFRLWTNCVCIRGLGFGVAAMVAGTLGGAEDPGVVAAVVAIYIAASSVIEIIYLMRKLDAAVTPLLRSMLPPYACGLIVAVPLLVADWPLGPSAFERFLVRGSVFVVGTAVFWAILSPRTYYSLWEMASRVFGKKAE